MKTTYKNAFVHQMKQFNLSSMSLLLSIFTIILQIKKGADWEKK